MAAVLEKQLQQWGGDGVGGTGHDMEWAAGQAQLSGVDAYDCELAPEAFPEVGGPAGMGLDGDDSVAGDEEGRGERAVSGADVEHQAAAR